MRMVRSQINCNRAGRLGMSMLELTAALFVFAVGLTAAFQTFHYTLSRMRVLKENGIAMRAIQNEMEALRVTDFAQLDSRSYAFSEQPASLEQLANVNATVSLRPFESGNPGLLVAEVTVQWTGDQGRSMAKSATTLVGDRGGAQ